MYKTKPQWLIFASYGVSHLNNRIYVIDKMISLSHHKTVVLKKIPQPYAAVKSDSRRLLYHIWPSSFNVADLLTIIKRNV